MSEKHRKYAAIVVLALLCVGTAVLWESVGMPLVRFASNPALFREWVDARGVWGRIAFVGMVVFQILVAVIPGEPFEIAAGYAFGVWEGTALCLLAAALGSVATFLLVRRFGRRLVLVFFTEEQLHSVRFLKSGGRRDMLFLIVYMLPGTPKDLLGYFAGLTDIRFPVWLFICTMGRIPSIVTSTMGGSALGSERYGMAALVFALTLAISAGGLVVYNHIAKHRGCEE